jgi:Patatin-like phospholipase
MTFGRLALPLLTIALLAGCGSLRAEKGDTCLAIEAGIPLPQPQFFKLPSVTRAVRFSEPVESELYVTPRNLPFVRNLLASIKIRTQAEPQRPYHVLALSAGGEVGAFGAGILAGWKYNLTNPPPIFDLVSGISTGALLAPLVFLNEDLRAKSLYTTIAADEIYRQRSIFELAFANSLVDTTPLHKKVQTVVTEDFVERIAAEGRTGRILAVQAVDLDAGDSVVFDLTAIAEGKNYPVYSELSRRECIIKAQLAALPYQWRFRPSLSTGRCSSMEPCSSTCSRPTSSMVSCTARQRRSRAPTARKGLHCDCRRHRTRRRSASI